MKVHKRLGEILIEAQKITKEQLKKALSEQSAQGGKIGETLLRLGFIDEENLYGALSKQLKIPMIPEEKFQRLKVVPEILKLIPFDFAAKNVVFPIQFDGERSSISVAMMDPTDAEVVKELKILCQSETVKRYLAQKSSILAAIDRYYQKGASAAPERAGEETAAGFKTYSPELSSPSISRTGARPASAQRLAMPSEVSEPSYNEMTENTIVNPELAAEMIAKSLVEEDTGYTVAPPQGSESVKIKVPPIETPKVQEETTASGKLGRIALKKQPVAPPAFKIAPTDMTTNKSDPPPASADTHSGFAAKPPAAATPPHGQVAKPSEHRVLLVEDHAGSASTAEKLLVAGGYQVKILSNVADALQVLKNSVFDLLLIKSTFAAQLQTLRSAAQTRNSAVQVRTFATVTQSLLGSPVEYDQMTETFFTTVDYLVSLLERQNPGMRRYAHTIAKYSKLVAQRLGLPRLTIDEIYFAAYLHDLWKLFSEAKPEEGTEHEARRTLVDFFSDQASAFQIVPIVRHLEEFYNGSGKPDGLKGEQIPIGSRVISVVRAFEEMLRSKLVRDAGEVAKVSKLLRKGADKKFDPQCVEAFVQVLETESFLETAGVAPIVETRNDVLLVDKDPQSTSLIELRLINEGFTVKVARDGQEAWRLIQEAPPTLIISDVVLPKIDGFNLCEMVKGNEQTKSIPFIFVSSRKDDFNMTKGLEMGADDYQTKPVNVPFLITKVRKLLEGKTPASAQPAAPQAGVSGNLSQMGLVEIIQILGGGNKTAFLQVKGNKGASAQLYMERGRIVSAFCGHKTGEEAFYEMMTWSEGSFSIIADRTAEQKNINNSNDFLLLEAMRRMDEAHASA